MNRRSMSKRLVLGCAVALLAAPLSARAQDKTSDGPEGHSWEFQLAGVGVTTQTRGQEGADNTALAATGAFGHYFAEDHLWGGFRQSILWINPDRGSSNTINTSRLALDYNFKWGAARPFVGVNFGLAYGDVIHKTDNVMGPEAGIKWYVRPQAFFLALVSYEAVFGQWNDLGDAWNDGGWTYSVGFGFNF